MADSPEEGAENADSRRMESHTQVRPNQNKSGGQTMLYNVEDEAVHILNPAARFFWDLCDGEHNLEDIVQALSSSFAVPPVYSTN